MPDSTTRVGWILGPAAGVLGVIFWGTNAWALATRGVVYESVTELSMGLLLLAVACIVCPGLSFRLGVHEARNDVAGVLLAQIRWWQVLLWSLALGVGLVIGHLFPDRILAPWAR